MTAVPLTIAHTNGQPHTDHTWQPHSLLELAANPPEPPSIGGLLYPGKRTILSGETESLKTWLALILCKAELDIGQTVCWADLDAMGPGAMLERLQLLGVPDQVIHDRFIYIEPSETLDPAKKNDLIDLLTHHQIRLMVVDAFNPILSLHGKDAHSTADIEWFWQTIADPICETGAAICLLDHVTKNAETRGKYAYGSERKASGAILHIGFRILETLTQGSRGRALLTVHKDRPGYLQRPVIGRLIVNAETTPYTYQLEPDKSHDPDHQKFRPTVLMERISRTLEPLTNPVSKTWVEENIQGNVAALRTALEALIDDGYITAKPGPRRAVDHTSTRPYRENEDTPQTTPSPLRPHSVPDLRSSHSVHPSPPPGGDGVGRRPTRRSRPDPVPVHGQPIPEYPYEPDMREPEPFDTTEAER